jgi:transketolase C-terminal domain/subunit
VLAALAADAPEAASRVHKIGVTDVPKSGGNDEVLRAHGLDAESIRYRVSSHLPSRV